VLPGNQSAHKADWNVVRQNTEWVDSNGSISQPFFLYQGLNIVHPLYDTSQEYIDRIDQAAIKVYLRALSEKVSRDTGSQSA
jgi:hypothetical protein